MTNEAQTEPPAVQHQEDCEEIQQKRESIHCRLAERPYPVKAEKKSKHKGITEQKVKGPKNKRPKTGQKPVDKLKKPETGINIYAGVGQKNNPDQEQPHEIPQRQRKKAPSGNEAF